MGGKLFRHGGVCFGPCFSVTNVIVFCSVCCVLCDNFSFGSNSWSTPNLYEDFSTHLEMIGNAHFVIRSCIIIDLCSLHCLAAVRR